MSGGAGYAISNKLYSLIVEYVKKNGIEGSFKHWCDDVCVGLWIQEISKENTVNQLNNNSFHIGLENNESKLETAITIHKVITKEQYDFYYAIYEKEINPSTELS
jgi:hypothetical protein